MGYKKLVDKEEFITKDSGKRFDVAPDPKTKAPAPNAGHGQGGKGH